MFHMIILRTEANVKDNFSTKFFIVEIVYSIYKAMLSDTYISTFSINLVGPTGAISQ